MSNKRRMRRAQYALPALLISVAALVISAQQPAREIDVGDTSVPDNYRVEAVVTNLSVPTTLIFDGNDMLVAESGYKNTAAPRVLRIKSDGTVNVEASEGLKGPVTGLLVKDGKLYVSHGGAVSIVEGGALRDIVTGLPSKGDHQNNQIVAGPDGKIYIGQGTTTNTGVVGVDRYNQGVQVHEQPPQCERRALPVEGLVTWTFNFSTN